ncbi:MAG: methylase, partial [Candidatus Synechococcus spongiarum SP3]
WMMDHIMNNRLSLEFGQTFVRIPLETSPNIVHGDALELDWKGVLKPEQCSYLFGNPPFVGQSYQSREQREQMRKLTNPHGKTGSPLDYVGAWFLKAAGYGTGAVRISFVATNSLTQGEQVALLWPRLFASGLEIVFAHRAFAWGSDARGKAHVHVVILGFDRQENGRLDKRLFSYPHLNGEPEETRHAALSPYLFDASNLADPHLVVTDSTRPLSSRPIMQQGVRPIDGGHFIFSDRERQDFLEQEPNAKRFFRPFIGAREHINGLSRWILFLEEAEPEILRTMPLSVERIRRVRAIRLASKRAATVRLAETPTRLEGRSIPTAPFLVIPEVSSERRDYIPIGWLKPPVIPSNLVRVIQNATLADFALLTSAMHMSWLRHIGGRLESRYRYSIGLVYNTFPLPPKDADLSKLEPLAQAVLDARAAHPGAALADLYDPDTMPPNLRRAHQGLDRGVDRLYRRSEFASERERVECLLMMYEGMQGVLGVGLTGKKKGRRGQ